MSGAHPDSLLNAVGLKEIMTERGNESAFDRTQFLTYTPQGYDQSETEARDAIHRMAEIVLLHKSTGLRIKYLTTESYFGDEYRYRMAEVYIITVTGERMWVSGIDLDQRIFTAQSGLIQFNEVSNSVDVD